MKILNFVEATVCSRQLPEDVFILQTVKTKKRKKSINCNYEKLGIGFIHHSYI